MMDSRQPVVLVLLQAIDRLSTAVETMEARLSAMEKMFFKNTIALRRKESINLNIFGKITKRILTIEKTTKVLKRTSTSQTDHVKKKEKINQTDRKTTRTIGSNVRAMADARSTQTEQKLEVVEKEASLVSESKVAKVPIRCSPGKVAVDTDIGESCTASATPSSKDPETEIYDRSFVKTPIFHSIPYTDESTYPRAADKGVFGAAMKSAPLHLRIVVSWMFFDAGVQGTDRALTKYFNRISWTDLKIHEFTVIRMETLQLQTMEEEVLFHEKVHMKLIERALTSPPEIAHMLANVCAAIHEEPTRTFVDPITRMVQRKELDLFLMRIVNFVVAAACLWVNHPTRIKKWTQALDKKTINKLSKFFHQVSENQFSRVAWFVCCLRNCGIAVPMHLHLIHIELLVQPMCYYEQGPRKLSFLRRYLKMLEKTTVESGGIGQWNEDVENPLYCEENVGYPSLTKLRRLIEARANADATQRKQEALKYIETVLMNKLRQEEWNVKLPTFPFICKS